MSKSNHHACMLLRGDFTHNLRVRKQAESLVRAGWKVTVVSLASDGQEVGSVPDPGGFDVHRVSNHLPSVIGGKGKPSARKTGREGKYRSTRRRRSSIVRGLRFVLNRVLVMFRMVRVIRRCRPDVVEAHNVNVLPAAFLGARMVGAPYIYDAHEINTEREGYYARLRTLLYLIERITVPRAALVLSTTEMRAQHYQDLYRLPVRPLVIHNKPPFSEVGPNHRLREKLGIPATQPIVLYQGGLQEGRGLHNLVRVSAKVKGGAFVFLGNGSQKDSLHALAESLGVTSKVYFHPAVPLVELPQFTAGADIGVQVLRNTCLNHYTTDSNKIFEYAMAGLAVVASDFPEIRRIIETYEYGVLVDPDDLNEIATVIQELVDDTEYRNKLRQNAIKSRRQLSWGSQEKTFLNAMEEVVVNSASF